MPHFSLQRSTVINAAPETVHGLINDFTQWSGWSPWEGLDPNLQRTYSGAESGTGAKYDWTGNKKVGTGSMEIINSTPLRIDIDLEFIEPFAASNLTVFDLTPSGDATMVTWLMEGKQNPLFWIMGKLYFNRAIGKDFDKGLADLKRLAEAA